MIRVLQATSISRPVHVWLAAHRNARLDVLVSTPRACNLLAEDGEIFAIVTRQVGDGPLNIVTSAVDLPDDLARTSAARISDYRLTIGSLAFDLERAALWEPRPDWMAARVAAGLPSNMDNLLAYVASEQVPDNTTLLALLGPERPAGYHGWDAIRQALKALQAGWQGDGDRLALGALSLAGLGPGLTPSGDDFMMGMMLQAWLSHPDPSIFCQRLRDLAAPLTTKLSAAWLRSAAGGMCSAPWHRLIDALSHPAIDRSAMVLAVQGVLAHGASSGADTLAGFLCFTSAALRAAMADTST